MIKDKLININSSCAGSLEYLLGGTWVLANSSVQVTKPCRQQIHWQVRALTIQRLKAQEMLETLILGAEAILQGKPGHCMSVSREDFCFLGGREKRLSPDFPLIGLWSLSFLAPPSSKGYHGMV